MNLFDFSSRFPDEQACRVHLRNMREQQGITCKSCGCTKHYWIESISKWRCSGCRTCLNLTSGTMMEKSKIDLRYWFMAIHLMTSTKKSFSALEMQRQLGLRNYSPVWAMMSKIRMKMGERDAKYALKGTIEVDDALFVAVEACKWDRRGNRMKDGKPLKRGRGSERLTRVLIMVESEPAVYPKRHEKKRKMGFVKMVVMDRLTSNAINEQVQNGVQQDAHLITDGYRAYNKLGRVVGKHTQMIVPPKEAETKLPWVHTVIANAKRQLLGVHHAITKEYLQNYLNEFCYKLNRRNFQSDMFDRMLLAAI